MKVSDFVKKILNIIFIYLLLGIRIVYASEFDITSDNVILYNLNDNEVIYEQNSEERVQIASLTKIMATIVAIENNENLDSEVVITKESLKGISEYTKVGFKVGDKVTVLYTGNSPASYNQAYVKLSNGKKGFVYTKKFK